MLKLIATPGSRLASIPFRYPTFSSSVVPAPDKEERFIVVGLIAMGLGLDVQQAFRDPRA